MTVDEAARTLSLAPATIRHQIRNGRLAATKRGRDWDIGEAEVVRYRHDSKGKPGRRAVQPTLGLI